MCLAPVLFAFWFFFSVSLQPGKRSEVRDPDVREWRKKIGPRGNDKIDTNVGDKVFRVFAGEKQQPEETTQEKRSKWRWACVHSSRVNREIFYCK